MFERCLYFNSNALARKVTGRWEMAFAELGLTPPQAYVLRVVLASPGISQQTLAGELQLEKSTVTRFVQVLEQGGWLRREASALDQREKVLQPTEQSMELGEALQQLGDSLYAEMKERLGERKLKQLVSLLREAGELL